MRGDNKPTGGPTLAEGIAVKSVAGLTVPIVQSHVSEIFLVDEPHLEQAVNAYLTLQKTMAEGAGAAGLAAILANPGALSRPAHRACCCRAEISIRAFSPPSWCASSNATTASCRSASPLPDRPGLLGQIATRLGELGANILEVDHKRLFLDVPAKGTRLDVTVETRDSAHADEIIDALEADGYRAGADRSRRRDGVIRLLRSASAARGAK